MKTNPEVQEKKFRFEWTNKYHLTNFSKLL